MRGMPSALHEPRPERVGKHRGYGPHRAFNHLELLAHAEVERVEPELLQTLRPGLQEPPRARVEEPDVPADPPQRHHDVLGVRVRRTREEGLRGPVAELEVQRPILALHDHVRPIRRHLRERDERSRGWQAELVVRDRRFALEPSGGVGEQRRRAAARGRQPRRAARRDVVRHHDTRRSHRTTIHAAPDEPASRLPRSDSRNNNDSGATTINSLGCSSLPRRYSRLYLRDRARPASPGRVVLRLCRATPS